MTMYYLQSIAIAAILVVVTSPLPASSTFDPATAIECYVHTGMRHLAEKEGCEPEVITVRGCWGRCDSFQIPALPNQLLDVSHPMCTPASYKNVTYVMSDCQPGVDPIVTYGEATTCGCRKIRGNVVHYGFRPDFYLP